SRANTSALTPRGPRHSAGRRRICSARLGATDLRTPRPIAAGHLEPRYQRCGGHAHRHRANIADRIKAIQTQWPAGHGRRFRQGHTPKDIDRIFDAFFTTKANGMGLAICRLVVEAHGGTLSVSPVAPHGAAFRLTLPGAS